MYGYFGHSIFPFLSFSRWVRYWLTLRLYPNKLYTVGGQPYITAPLTVREKAIIFAVHLVLLTVLFGGAILSVIVAARLIYG